MSKNRTYRALRCVERPSAETSLRGARKEPDGTKWAVAAGVAGLIGVLALVNFIMKPKK